MEPLSIEEQKKALQEEMERIRKDVFIFGKQMKYYANLSAVGDHKQRSLVIAAQIKTTMEEKTQYYEQLERDLKAL